MDNTKEDLCTLVGTEAVLGTEFFAPTQLPSVVTAELIEEFKEWIDATVQPQTIESYACVLRMRCLGKPIAVVNHKAFFVALRKNADGEKAKAASIMRNISAVKKFLVFLSDKYDMHIIELHHIHCKKPEAQNPVYLEKEEMEAIRNLPVENLMELRDRTLFEFFLDTGARVSEAMSIDWCNIDFKNKQVAIIGKGGKHRMLRLNFSMPWILKYLDKRKSDAAPLFLTYRFKRLARADAHTAMQNLGERAGLTKHVHPHMLRHSYGTHLMRTPGVEPKTVQQLMGHSDIGTTFRYYIGVSDGQMKTAHVELGKLIGGAGPDE